MIQHSTGSTALYSRAQHAIAQCSMLPDRSLIIHCSHWQKEVGHVSNVDAKLQIPIGQLSDMQSIVDVLTTRRVHTAYGKVPQILPASSHRFCSQSAAACKGEGKRGCGCVGRGGRRREEQAQLAQGRGGKAVWGFRGEGWATGGYRDDMGSGSTWSISNSVQLLPYRLGSSRSAWETLQGSGGTHAWTAGEKGLVLMSFSINSTSVSVSLSPMVPRVRT